MPLDLNKWFLLSIPDSGDPKARQESDSTYFTPHILSATSCRPLFWEELEHGKLARNPLPTCLEEKEDNIYAAASGSELQKHQKIFVRNKWSQ